jgi:hypothetical protein
MAQDTSGDTSGSLAEDLSALFVALIVFGLNPATVIVVGMMWYIPMTVPFTVLEQPIVKDMMYIGMVQYLEFWMLFLYLWSEYTDRKRPITPRNVGTVLLGTIPYYGLAYFALLTPISMVLKIVLIILSIVGGLPIIAKRLNMQDLFTDP